MGYRNYQGARDLISVLLLSFVAVVSGYLWFTDLLKGQRAFGVLLSAVLLGFSMLVYTYRKPNYQAMSRPLLVLGYLALAALLSLSIAVSLGYAA